MRATTKFPHALLRVAAPVLAALALHCEDDPSSLRGRPGSRGTGGDPAGDVDPTEVSDADDASVAESGPARDAGGPDAADAGSSPPELCVAIINELRATLNAPPLQRWTAGESCAAGQATSDKAANKPHGAFPGCGESAQNECLGVSSPLAIRACLKAMWAEGPGGGHYENMRSTRFTSVACGFGQPTNGGWAVQNFR